MGCFSMYLQRLSCHILHTCVTIRICQLFPVIRELLLRLPHLIFASTFYFHSVPDAEVEYNPPIPLVHFTSDHNFRGCGVAVMSTKFIFKVQGSIIVLRACGYKCRTQVSRTCSKSYCVRNVHMRLHQLLYHQLLSPALPQLTVRSRVNAGTANTQI